MVNSDKTTAPDYVAKALLDRNKVVFLFGAGPSLSSGIAGAKTLKKELWHGKLRVRPWNEGKENLRGLLEAVGVKSEHLTSSVKFDPDAASFEQLITVACKLEDGATQEEKDTKIAEWLEERIPDVYGTGILCFPSLGYEFTCHLMSNGLVRYVVNMNYDEILDRALEQEMRRESCFRVVTLEDFQRLANTNVPDWSTIADYFLIKPHGTRSMRRSCCFRLEHVERFERDKAQALKEVLRRSILVMVGYEAADTDFKNLLMDLGLNNLDRIVVVKRNPERTIKNLNLPPESVVVYPSDDEEFFTSLADSLYNDERYEKFCTTATRHFIRSEVNRRVNPINEAKKQAQTLARKENPLFFERLSLLVEILIYCFKVRGLFTTRALASCVRITNALDDYLARSKGNENPVECLLEELAAFKEGSTAPVLKVKEAEAFRNWYYLPYDGREYSEQDHADLFRPAARSCAEFLAGSLEVFLKGEEKGRFVDRLAELLSRLTTDFDYDLAKDSSFYFFPFRSIECITTREEFRKRTEDILRVAREFHNLYVISPSVAEWLAGWGCKELDSSQTMLRVIVNKDVSNIRDSLHFKNIEKRLAQLTEFAGRGNVVARPKLAYGLTLALKESGGKISGKAIIFIRDGKASAFSPVFIEEEGREDSCSNIAKLKASFEKMFNGSAPLDIPLPSKAT